MGGKKKSPKNKSSKNQPPENKTPENKRRRKTPSQHQDEEPTNENEDSGSEESDSDQDEPDTDQDEPTNKEVIASVLASQEFLSSKFDALSLTIKQLVQDNITLKNDVQQLQNTTHLQQQQIVTLSNELQEVRQELLQKDLVLTGLPNLASIGPDIILAKAAEIYNFPLTDVMNSEIISGINKISKKPFNMIFLTMRTESSKRDILAKQKSIGPIVWDQLTSGVPDNLKTNKLRFNSRLTKYKQSILNEGKKFSYENKQSVPFVWEKFGKILLKENNATRPITLNSLADLELIKKKYEPDIMKS
jgi:hypothetical protein